MACDGIITKSNTQSSFIQQIVQDTSYVSLRVHFRTCRVLLICLFAMPYAAVPDHTQVGPTKPDCESVGGDLRRSHGNVLAVLLAGRFRSFNDFAVIHVRSHMLHHAATRVLAIREFGLRHDAIGRALLGSRVFAYGT